MYLLCVNGEAIECDSLLEVASYFNIEITDKGSLICDGIVDSVSYDTDKLDEGYILKFFISHRLTKLLGAVKLYKIKEKL